MSPFLLTVLFFGLVTASKDEIKHSRHKRDLMGLCSMIASQTNYRMCLRLLHHGNHCGPLRNNGHVTSPIDQCCFNHDQCSEATRMSCGTPLIGIIFGSYRWVTSATDGRIHCVQNFRQCAYAQCVCDSQLAMCVGAVTRANLQRFNGATRTTTGTATATGIGPATRTETGSMVPGTRTATVMGPATRTATGILPATRTATGILPATRTATGILPATRTATGILPATRTATGTITGLLPRIGSATGTGQTIGTGQIIDIGQTTGTAAIQARSGNLITNTNTGMIGMTPFQPQRRNHQHFIFSPSM